METLQVIAALKQMRGQLDQLLSDLEPKPAPAPVGRVPENPTGTVAGVDYAYYEGIWQKLPDFDKLKVLASGTTTHPHLGVRKRDDFFGLRITGFLYVPADAEYTFYLNSDDGTRLSFGNVVVAENDGIHGAQERSGKILLQKGAHAFTLDYFDYNNEQVLELRWSSAALAKALIPAAAYSRLPSKPIVTNLSAVAS